MNHRTAALAKAVTDKPTTGAAKTHKPATKKRPAAEPVATANEPIDVDADGDGDDSTKPSPPKQRVTAPKGIMSYFAKQ